MEIQPRRGWTKSTLHSTEKLTLHPDEMVLGRLMERFAIPSNCAGMLEGRSSYARMGLTVHATGSFINPGWSGHMPLTLVNHGPVTLQIPVGTPLAQLIVIALEGPPDADYAVRTDRKYMHDTGGPSYWWRDQLMEAIRSSMSAVHIESRVFDELDELLAVEPLEDEVFVRLEDFVAQSKRNFVNAGELLDAFAVREGERSTHSRLGRWAATATPAIPLGLFTSSFYFSLPGWIRLALLAVLVVSCVGPLWTLTHETPEYLTPTVLGGIVRRRVLSDTPVEHGGVVVGGDGGV